ncbi:TPA: aquaporin [Pseudomonas aeruginosa]
MSTSRKILAETLGTAVLLCTVVGSGIMAQRLANGNDALALLANALATGASLYVLILCFASFSGAHFNPVVSVVDYLRGGLSAKLLGPYIAAQAAGAILGVFAAHLMFELPVVEFSQHVRTGPSQWFSEYLATSGLVLTILLCDKYHKAKVPQVVAAFVVAAYWFTSSTSFANPAVTLARSFTDTFSGIRLSDAAPFIISQFFGGLTALFLARFLSGNATTLEASQPALGDQKLPSR